jgi:hypothetical protein
VSLAVTTNVLDTSGIPPSNNPPTLSTNPLFCPRKDTVAALWEQLQRVHVMHVRGTPTTGKSVLADLFQEYVQGERPDIQIHLFNWPLNIKEFEYQNYYHLLNKLTNEPLTRRDNWLKRQNTLIIIDEAQRSYTFYSFWDEFIKRLASDGGGPLVILFSSFGSAAGRPVEVPIEFGSAPVQFRPDQRISIQLLPYTNPKVSLYFNREEFNDAVARLCKEDRNSFILSKELMQHIWELTSGHPGAVRAVMEMLIHSEVSIS